MADQISAKPATVNSLQELESVAGEINLDKAQDDGVDVLSITDGNAGIGVYGEELVPFVVGSVFIRFLGNGSSRHESGAHLDVALKRSVQPFVDFKNQSDLGKVSSPDMRIYLPAHLSAYYVFRFAPLSPEEVSSITTECGVIDNDPRNAPYGNSAATLAKYYGLNTTDAGCRASLELFVARRLKFFAKSGYYVRSDVNTDVHDNPSAPASAYMQGGGYASFNTVAGVVFGFGGNDLNNIFAQLQHMPVQLKENGDFTQQYGVAAGGQVALAGGLLLPGAQGYYYWMDRTFAAYEEQYGAMASLKIKVGDDIIITPYYAISVATNDESLGSSKVLTDGPSRTVSERVVHEPGAQVDFLKNFYFKAATPFSGQGTNPNVDINGYGEIGVKFNFK